MQDQAEPAVPLPRVASVRSEARSYDPYARRRALSVKLTQTIYLIFGLVEVLLLIRFGLKALAANAEPPFAQFVYGVTAPLVAPFLGLFGVPTTADGVVLEPYTLLALAIYPAVGWFLAKGAWLLFGETRSAQVARTDTVQTRLR